MRISILKIRVIFVITLFFLITASPITNAFNFTEIFEYQSSYPTNNQQISDDVEYYAIILGIENFIGIEFSEQYIDETAFAFYEKLRTGDNWKKDNIKILLNENATKNNIRESILNWLKPIEREEDVILFYFVGHSNKIPDEEKNYGNAFLLPYNAHDDILSDEKITDIELDSWFDELETKHMTIILDTRYSGKMNKINQFGRVILSSSRIFSNKVIEDNKLGYCIFSYYLMEGLEIDADNNNDEWVSINELFQYSRKHSFNHSLKMFFNSITNNSEIFIPSTPSIFNRHFGEISIMSLSYGWEQLTNNGFGAASNYATRGMTVFKNELYIGTQNNVLPSSLEWGNNIWQQFFFLIKNIKELSSEGNIILPSLRSVWHLLTWSSFGCEVWKYNYSTNILTPVIGKNSISGLDSGFDYVHNAAASIMKEFKGHLYIGTWSTPIGSIQEPNRKGCEIWRSSDGVNWEQVVGENAPFTKGGFGNPDNVGAWSIEEFNGCFYVGTMNWDTTEGGGCEIWRSSDGLHWNQVVENGFRLFMPIQDRENGPVNTYAWVMKEYQDQLYVGTFNSKIKPFVNSGKGCQLWRTKDGLNWSKVDLPDGNTGDFKDGFGEMENYGIRRLTIYNDELYVGIATHFLYGNGCEIWKYNGTHWTPVISDDVPGVKINDIQYDGFGNPKNKYIWSMTATSDNKLWVGTANVQITPSFIINTIKSKGLLIESMTEGFEIWCYDGINWTPIIKNEVGMKQNGLGNVKNLGARSMIEYPENSGNIVIGTFNIINLNPSIPWEGCELWMRSSY